VGELLIPGDAVSDAQKVLEHDAVSASDSTYGGVDIASNLDERLIGDLG
jgi:hypothetical protein